MKKTFFAILVVAVLLSFSTSVEAQYRKDANVDTAPVEVYDQESVPFSFREMFNGGMGLTTGALTSSVMWRMSNKLFARADVSFMHTPFGTGDFQQVLGSDSYNKVYLRNAELMYKPNEKTSLYFSYRQHPGALGIIRSGILWTLVIRGETQS